MRLIGHTATTGLKVRMTLLAAGLGVFCAMGGASTASAKDNKVILKDPAKDPAKDPKDAKDAKDKKGGKSDTEDDFPVLPEDPGRRKVFSAAEVARVCQKHEGTLIAYYDDVYKVEKCKRRPILDNKTVYNLQRDGAKVQDVDGDTIAALPEGEPVDEAMTARTARGCAALEHQYITYSNVDVYFVEHCKKKIFPDWTTYIKHRETRGDKKGEILSLSWVEFARLQDGPAIPSIVDDLFAKLLTGEAGVEIIPVDEACEGVEGKVVSYYSRVYKIEHCHKHEIVDADLYLMKLGFDKVKIVELKSEQWISLPEGKPIIEKQAQRAEGSQAKSR